MPVHTVKDSTTNDELNSEDLEIEFPLNDEKGRSCYNSSSEKCDTDSVDEEIATSMMTVLLPRALPLLKTYTRKKKKGVKASKTHPNGSQEGNKIPNFSINYATIGKVFSYCQTSDYQLFSLLNTELHLLLHQYTSS